MYGGTAGDSPAPLMFVIVALETEAQFPLECSNEESSSVKKRFLIGDMVVEYPEKAFMKERTP